MRELGTLKALGWTQRKVVRQVAAESLAQGVLGGVLGVALGVGVALLIGLFGPTLTASSTTAAGNLFGVEQAARTTSEAVSLSAPVGITILLAGFGLALLSSARSTGRRVATSSSRGATAARSAGWRCATDASSPRTRMRASWSQPPTLRNFFGGAQVALRPRCSTGKRQSTPRRSSEMQSTKSKIAGVTAVAAALVGGGAAVAADRLTPEQESDAVVADAAKQLGVDASKLDAALKQALSNRVDAAVEAGQITEAQGDEMKARIAAGEVPLVGVGGKGLHPGVRGHRFADLDAAATYLGLTAAELKTSLSDGSTLAEIAKEKDKSVDGLKDALVTAAKADLAQAVEDGRLTEAQQAEIVAELPDRIDDLVNGELGAKRGDHGPRGFGFGGPPPADDA